MIIVMFQVIKAFPILVSCFATRENDKFEPQDYREGRERNNSSIQHSSFHSRTDAHADLETAVFCSS